MTSNEQKTPGTSYGGSQAVCLLEMPDNLETALIVPKRKGSGRFTSVPMFELLALGICCIALAVAGPTGGNSAELDAYDIRKSATFCY